MQRCDSRRRHSIDAVTAEQFHMEWAGAMRDLWLVGTHGMD
jgi:hypothetical protein